MEAGLVALYSTVVAAADGVHVVAGMLAGCRGAEGLGVG